MASQCDYCGKGVTVGRQSRHKRGVAGRQWAKRAQKTARLFKPNLQTATLDGLKLKLCTRCLKRFKAGAAVSAPVENEETKVAPESVAKA